MSQGALENITVLDLTRVLAGPFTTMILADMGANVIKIEIPEKGDDTRHFGPFQNEESLYYANINRNKKGVTLNLKDPEGKKMFLEMAKKADVVVENYRPGVMDKLGLGYEKLSEVNEKIIYAAVSGFGSYGPYTDRPGYDIIAQAMGGIMSITGKPGDGPVRVGNAMGDVLGGLSLTIGILAAINGREVTGKGQKVDVSLVDSVVASLEIGIQRYIATEELPEKMGNRYASAYPYDTFMAKDGYFVIGCGNQKLFENLVIKAMQKPELLEDERFLNNDLRCDNHAPLKAIIEDWSKNFTIDEVVEMILNAGCPAAPIFDMQRLLNDEHIAGAREMFVPIKHPKIGEMKVNGCHIKLSDTKPQVKTPSPDLGQDNEAVYQDMLNISPDDLKQLLQRGVI
ncbi:MAG: CoA transferase [Tindallia sp. MSAO_Bac2]|nr:MAG: CoA transferase [Tindallia sp. MSAO_Bac2]